jgi:predicted peptidase
MRWSIFLLLFIFSFSLFGQDSVGDIQTGTYLDKQWSSGNNQLNYRILYPHDFDSQKQYPLILFLHGMGERGVDNKTQMRHGSKLFLDSLKQYPAIVVFPQCPPTDYWANLYRPDEGGAARRFTFHTDEGPNPSLKMVLELTDDLLDKPYIDASRFYVSGLSMGAMGVWELLWRIPERIAAALPICGAGPVEKASAMSSVPLWIFHGASDSVVNPNYSIQLTKKIQQSGGKAKISLYPNVNHNAWDRAFAEPDFLSWMFSKKKT